MAPLHRFKERVLVAQTILGLVKALSGARLDKADSADLLLIGCAVLVAQSRGKPAGASDIARAIGIPRSTVVRKLYELAGRGLIVPKETKYHLSDMSAEAADVYLNKATAIIRDAAAMLK